MSAAVSAERPSKPLKQKSNQLSEGAGRPRARLANARFTQEQSATFRGFLWRESDMKRRS